MQYLELGANLFFLISVFLAARNSIHTWWLGIIGCLLFALLFYKVQLYADVTLMFFFIATSIYGWCYWNKGDLDAPISKSASGVIILLGCCAGLTALLYGWFLYVTTDAYAPYVDSLVLMFSVLAQFLLMRRKIETWWFWLLVDTIAVPLYISRELYVTAAVYACFWFNAWYGLYLWKCQLTKSKLWQEQTVTAN